MRVIVFFDLPTETAKDRSEYGKFRRKLIKSGFMMLQESVYVKMALNTTEVAKITEAVVKIKPEKGLVQILSVTEKQFSKMEIVSGKVTGNVLSTDERLVFI